MTLRGIFKAGVVILEDTSSLREGDVVDVRVSAPAEKRKGRTLGRAPKGRAKSAKLPKRMPEFGFGMWKHRDDIGDTVAFVAELQKLTNRGRPGAGRLR
jgi:hypothetical protein